MKNREVYFELLQKINFRTIFGFTISGALLWLTFNNSGLHVSDIRLKGNQWYYFITAIGLFIFSLWLYSLRAKLIWLSDTRKSNSIFTYQSLIIGNFYNCILPGNLGEGVRAWHFSKKNNVSFVRSLAAIITEKWLDAQVFSVLVIVLLAVKPFIQHYISFALAYMALMVLVLSIVHIVLHCNRGLEKNIWYIVPRFKKAKLFLFKIYSHTNNHLRNMRYNRNIRVYIFFFLFIFFLNVLQFYFLLKAAGVACPVAGMYSACMIALSMMIIAFIPSAPSNIGVLHYGVYSVLILSAMQYHIQPDTVALQSYALFGIYAHLSFLVPEVIMGGGVILKERRTIFLKMEETNEE